MRPSGRASRELRAVTIQRNFTKHAEGSLLIGFGDTLVLCTASIEDGVPPFLRGSSIVAIASSGTRLYSHQLEKWIARF